MKFIQNITENYSSFRIAIYNEEEILYNSKLIGVQRESRINYDKENLFYYHQKIASDFFLMSSIGAWGWIWLLINHQI